MLSVVGRRLATIVPMLLILILGVLLLMDLTPGDPAAIVAGDNATAQDIEETRERLGLNDSILERYVGYLGDLARGDMGTSLYTNRPVSEAILAALPVTLWLTFLALAVALLVAVPLGVLAAVKRGSAFDRIISSVSAGAMAAPPFAIGLLLVTVFAVNRSWFPAGGYVALGEDPTGWALSVTLPALALAVDPAAELVRQTRGAVVDVLERDYVQTAVAMGIPRRVVIAKYAGKNAAVPVVTVLGLQAARVLGGAVVIELIFTLPGLGSEALNAVLYHDYPMIQGIVLVSAALILLMNLIVDASYTYFDPKLRG
ncbi:ABC transporter permease [Polymorphospora sp. A560]